MTGQISFSPEEDVVGKETLDLFAGAHRFNEWMFAILSRYGKDNILEIGSGIGNISTLLLKKYEHIFLSDLRTSYCEILKNKFRGNTRLKDVFQVDLGEADLHRTHPTLIARFDSILASNVVEHVEDDTQAIRNCFDMLKPGGKLIVLVPAYGFLYNGLDKDLGHFRRYNRKNMTSLFIKEGFTITHTQYFNAAGIFGWWFSGSVLKKTILPKNQLSLYNKLIPLFRVFDMMILNKIGLSLIVVGEKN